MSRGLDEAMLNFIAKANGPEYSIRASVYEFSYMPVLDAKSIAGLFPASNTTVPISMCIWVERGIVSVSCLSQGSKLDHLIYSPGPGCSKDG